jgi:hypothetical protein
MSQESVFASCRLGDIFSFVATTAAPVGPRVDRYQTDASDPDRATALTVELMCQQISRSALDDRLRAAALDAVRRFRGGPEFAATGQDPFQSPAAICESVWWWAKHILRFQHHEGLIRVWFSETDQLQLLISPALLLRMEKPRGDCAIYTTLICAMLRASGIEYEIVTLAVDPNQPEVFGHVYPRAVLPDGRRLVLDASHGKYVGWEVPKEHQLRRQVWDSAGNPIPDADRGRFRGLRGYQPRPRRPMLPRRLTALPGGIAGYGRGGFGQYIDTGEYVPTTSSTTGYTPPDITAVAVPVSPTPGFNLGSTIGNLLNQWTQIGSRVIAPTTTVSTGPGGTQIVTPAGSNLPASALLAPGIAGASGGGLLLLIGGAIVVVALIAGRK